MEEPIKDCIICQGKNLGNNMIRLYATNFSICVKCEYQLTLRTKKKLKLSTNYKDSTVKQLKMSYLELWITKFKKILAGMAKSN